MSFVHRHTVRFQEVDAAGIVFFPRILEWFHDAYVAFWAASGVRLDEVLRTRAYLVPLKHAEADFARPLRFGEEIEIALVSGTWEGSKLTVRYRVTRGADEVATGATVHVFVDGAFKRIEPPAELRDAFSRLAA